MDGVQALAGQLARLRLSSDADSCVSGIADAAVSVRRMLDLALDFKAVAGNTLELKSGPVRLRELMDAIQAGWQPRATQAGVALLVSYDGDPDACILADGLRLRQVFDGFIGEAMAGAGHDSVEVSLRATPAAGGLRLDARVRGGRDPAWRCQNLEARIREVDARLGLEVALGVVLARRMLFALSGSLADEPAAGAAVIAFELTAPLAEAAPAPAPQAEPGLEAIHVLVVDDNATNRVVAQALCEMLGFTSEAAEDGVEAVEAVAAGRFDVILMDIRMPRMDGVEATREIRKLPGRARATPIIALTATVDPDDAQAYRAAGMSGVLEKPIKA
jgi:CheY-like chemotaxis protein